MSHREAVKSLRPTEKFDLESGLSLVPRVNVKLTIFRGDKTVSSVDEWKLKRSLVDYFQAKHSVSIPDEDIKILKYKDLNKRKREDPVAIGCLSLLDLGFLSKKLALSEEGEIEKDFSKLRMELVAELDGMELNLEGVKFKLRAELPKGDDLDGLREEWEDTMLSGARGYRRNDNARPDTIILRGAPSRWFAEPRVSPKPSMLVTHTIFSTFGKIRNLDVGEDDGVGINEYEEPGDIVSGLQCKIVVQFESHRDFCDAMKVLCGRSLIKQGSRMRSDYVLSWDKDGFFRSGRGREQDIKRWIPAPTGGDIRSEARRKRFKD